MPRSVEMEEWEAWGVVEERLGVWEEAGLEPWEVRHGDGGGVGAGRVAGAGVEAGVDVVVEGDDAVLHFRRWQWEA